MTVLDDGIWVELIYMCQFQGWPCNATLLFLLRWPGKSCAPDDVVMTWKQFRSESLLWEPPKIPWLCIKRTWVFIVLTHWDLRVLWYCSCDIAPTSSACQLWSTYVYFDISIQILEVRLDRDAIYFFPFLHLPFLSFWVFLSSQLFFFPI